MLPVDIIIKYDLITLSQIPTCLLYNQKGRVLAWGLEAKNAGQIHGTVRCEWFKVLLETQHLHGDAFTDPRLPHLPVSLHFFAWPIIDMTLYHSQGSKQST